MKVKELCNHFTRNKTAQPLVKDARRGNLNRRPSIGKWRDSLSTVLLIIFMCACSDLPAPTAISGKTAGTIDPGLNSVALTTPISPSSAITPDSLTSSSLIPVGQSAPVTTSLSQTVSPPSTPVPFSVGMANAPETGLAAGQASTTTTTLTATSSPNVFSAQGVQTPAPTTMLSVNPDNSSTLTTPTTPLTLNPTTQNNSTVAAPPNVPVSSKPVTNPKELQLAATSSLLPGHSGSVNQVALSPDGKMLASGSSDGTIKLWRMPQADLLSTWQTGFPVYSLAFSPDGKTLLSNGKYEAVILWDTTTGKPLATLNGYPTAPSDITYMVLTVAFAPDGKSFASLSNRNTLVIWNAATLKPRFTIKNVYVGGDQFGPWTNGFAYSPDGQEISAAAWTDDNPNKRNLTLWRVADGAEIAEPENGEDLRTGAVAFSPDGKLLAAGALDGQIKVWETTSGRLVTTARVEVGSVNSLAFSPDGKSLASGSGWTNQNTQYPEMQSARKAVEVWEVTTGRLEADLEGHAYTVYSVIFSPDGKTLVSAGLDSTIKVWSLPEGVLKTTLAGNQNNVTAAAFSPDHKLVANGREDGSIEIIEQSSGKLLAHFQAHPGRVLSITFSPDNTIIYSAGGASKGASVESWEAGTGKLRRSINWASDEPAEIISSLALSPDGKTLVGANYNTLIVWATSTGQPLKQISLTVENITTLKFNSSGSIIAAGNLSGQIGLWDLASGQQILSYRDPDGGEIEALAFSPDGQKLAFSTNQKKVKIWKFTTPQIVLELLGVDTVTATNLAFSPDNKLLVAGSSQETFRGIGHGTDGKILVWNVSNTQNPYQKIASSPVEQTAGVRWTEFSKDRKSIFSVYTDGTVRVWQLN